MSSVLAKPLNGFWVYQSFIRNSFLLMLAYRLRYYTGILTYLLMVSVQYFIWKAVYQSQGDGAALYGYSLAQMVTYVSIGWISRSFYFSNIDREIDELVRSGQISIYLIRPVNFQIMMLAQALGESLFRAMFFSIPIALVLFWVYPIMGPAGGLDFIYFCVSTFVSFLILGQLNFLVGLCAFYLKSIMGIMRAKYYVIQLFSGLLLPLSFFPEKVRLVLEFLPFQTIAHTPLQFYLGKVEGEQLAQVFFQQMTWLLILFGLGHWAWRKAMAKLTLQGG